MSFSPHPKMAASSGRCVRNSIRFGRKPSPSMKTGSTRTNVYTPVTGPGIPIWHACRPSIPMPCRRKPCRDSGSCATRALTEGSSFRQRGQAKPTCLLLTCASSSQSVSYSSSTGNSSPKRPAGVMKQSGVIGKIRACYPAIRKTGMHLTSSVRSRPFPSLTYIQNSLRTRLIILSSMKYTVPERFPTSGYSTISNPGSGWA